MERFDEKELAETLAKLPHWKKIAFAAACCERMIPNYGKFSAETGFGDVSVIRSAIDLAWKWVETGRQPSQLEILRNACDEQAPDTTELRSNFVSSALDAANAAAILLEAIACDDEARPVEVASLARDTVDLLIQFSLDHDPNSPAFEGAILRHELMQRELRQQRADLEVLAKWIGPRKSVVDWLRTESGRFLEEVRPLSERHES